MKRKAIWSLLLSLTFLVSMSIFPAATQAQPRHRFRADTGVITLGMGQILRVTVNGRDGNDTFSVRFAWMKYMLAGCNTEGVCRHTVQSHGVTASVNFGSNEAASFDVQGTGGGVRVEVLADFNTNGAVDSSDAMIINAATGEVTHVIVWMDRDLQT